MMQRLAERGLTRVLCEGGGRLAAALLHADLVDELVAYTAGLVLGEESVPAVGPLEVEALQLAPRFRLRRRGAGRPRRPQPLAPQLGPRPGRLCGSNATERNPGVLTYGAARVIYLKAYASLDQGRPAAAVCTRRAPRGKGSDRRQCPDDQLAGRPQGP